MSYNAPAQKKYANKCVQKPVRLNPDNPRDAACLEKIPHIPCFTEFVRQAIERYQVIK